MKRSKKPRTIFVPSPRVRVIGAVEIHDGRPSASLFVYHNGEKRRELLGLSLDEARRLHAALAFVLYTVRTVPGCPGHPR